MRNYPPKKQAHPTGERKKGANKAISRQENQPVSCDSYAGKVRVEWDQQASVTPLGQLPFFIDFLKTTKLFDDWVESCPLEFSSLNSPSKRNILGTIFLSVLGGHTRYSHITRVRNDTVNPPLLGMTKVVSEDSARRAFQISKTRFTKEERDQIQLERCDWQRKNLYKSYSDLFCEPWILDVDATVKPLYGSQEGAEVGYNPQKPGRPSHITHSYIMGETRLLLDAEVLPGKQTAASYSLPALRDLLDSIPQKNHPTVVRGDCAYGNEKVLSMLESKRVNHLFKVRKTKAVKGLINLLETCESDWVDAGQGWEGLGAELKLSGWSKKRKVVVIRRPLPTRRGRPKKTAQLLLPFFDMPPMPPKYEYSVLITNLSLSIFTLAQLYRDRGDAENTFDELKNQWGWSGFVTRDLHRSQIMARIIAQIYNWWSLFVRLADPSKRHEAITSRPLLLHGVGRKVRHGRQERIVVTQTHGDHKTARKMLSRTNRVLRYFKSLAEQLSKQEIWKQILSVIFSKFLRGRILGSISGVNACVLTLDYG